MTLYADCEYLVRDDIAAVHAQQIANLGAPGTWLDGPQRRAIAAAARRACLDAGVLEAPDGWRDDMQVDLPDVIRTVVERLAVAPQDVDYASYQKALVDGLSDAEYVEIVGLVARTTNFDIFARGIGVALQPLPPAQDGEASRVRPAVAVQELAWAPNVPLGEAGGDLGKELYHGRPLPYIHRCMSLVPEEFRHHMALEQVQYLPMGKVLIADYAHHEGLSRAQAEIVAARVSALNECFF